MLDSFIRSVIPTKTKQDQSQRIMMNVKKWKEKLVLIMDTIDFLEDFLYGKYPVDSILNWIQVRQTFLLYRFEIKLQFFLDWKQQTSANLSFGTIWWNSFGISETWNSPHSIELSQRANRMVFLAIKPIQTKKPSYLTIILS